MLTRSLTKIFKNTKHSSLSAHLTRKPIPFNTSFLPSNLYSQSLYRFSSTNKPDEVNKYIPPQTIHTDEEFNDVLEKIDLNDEQIAQSFETNLQSLSIKLLQATTSEEVLDIYEKTIGEYPDISGEELCMTLYFACYCRNNVVDDPRFQELIKQAFEKIETASPLYLFALIHALGTYSLDFGLVLPSIYQQTLANTLIKNMETFQINQISAAAWATAQLISDTENIELQHRVILEFASTLLGEPMSLTALDFANILSTFTQCGINNKEIINEFVKLIKKSTYKFDNEDPSVLTRLVMALGEFNLEDDGVLGVIFEEVIRAQIDNFSVDNAAILMLVFAEKLPSRQNYFRELVKRIHANPNEVNISSYLNVWLTLAKLRIQASDLEKTLGVLKRIPWENKIWTLKELEGFEFVNIIVAMSMIRMNDKRFLEQLLPELEKRVKDLAGMDLVNLVRAFTLYVTQFEDFYLKLHAECVNRKDYFSSQEKNLLKETFTKAKKFLPESPFVEVGLY